MKSRFIRTTILIASVFLIVNISRSIIDLLQKGSLLDREEERFAKARFENEELRREYEKLQSPEHIEQEARGKLGLARPGETIVVIPKNSETLENPTTETKKVENIPVWRQWVDFFLN